MMWTKHLIVISVLTLSSTASAGFFAFSAFDVITCRFKECCNDRWISTNFTDLSHTLSSTLYGQHLVTEPVVKHLKGHARENPSKALALSFHGLTGTGKNYVSRIVAEKMFRKGMKSKYFHFISATREFPHSDMISFYKDKLRDIIERAVKECPRSLIVIDEMDKMPPGVIDTIKPYLDFYEEIGGVDYRKSTFFFLSNTAGTDIAERTIKYWSEGIPRENIRLKEMEEVIRLPALNQKESGLWHSELITKNLISSYIPFLPLERKHVKQCIRDGLVQRGFYSTESVIPDSKVQEIADELKYYPQDLYAFSSTGCKRILDKITLVMEHI
ncbi:torsin-1A-like [Mya arenaria]|uniref:torsin-1A-like n=1 Tax=Mya arenaria TaxID=6604 RepID=UPI0022DEA8C6|nr:torsin-1A-like [Mya arenaria]